MNINTAKRFKVAIIVAAAVTWFAGAAHALKAPHDYTRGLTCANVGANKGCHSKTNFYKNLTSFNSLCFNTAVGCHNSAPANLAPKKVLSMKDASNRFGRIAQSPADAKQSSHGWKIPFKNSTSGRRAGVPSNQMLSEKRWSTGLNSANIFCTRCHRVMGDSLAKGDKFLREPATGNYICFQCHSARRIDNVRDYNSSVASGTLHYSHPVEVNYSTARAAKPDFFNTTFRLATGYDESARPRLYTTHASAQGGTKKGAVVCQSCHGPMHAADSNPYTFDNITYYSGQGKYSSSAGNLLRTYPIVGPKASNNLCLSCHKVQTHQSFMCGRCHTPHKKAGENNRYLILENISTPSSGRRSVAFTSRSEMAARFSAGYSSTQARTVRQVSNRICQVCHMARKFHNNYSSPGGTVSRTHMMTDEGDPSQKYKFCPDCHKHTGGFTPSGCATCHNFPPNDVIDSTASFKHAKHTNGNVEPTPSNTFWKTGKATDSRSDTSYGFSCERCHSPWPLYTAFGLGDGYKGKNHYGANVISQKIYTADVGFKIRTTINARPWNPLGSYLYATGGPIDSPGNGQFRGAGAGATCYNLYCHGNFYNGYTSNNPTATGTQACGKCHGASNTDPPGKTGGVNYGAHPRHVGSANNQQYGSGTPNFRCNACHSLTSKYNNETTLSSRKYHVNGIVNIKFDNGSSSNFRVGNGSSNYGGYGGYDGYTSRRPAMSNPFSNSRPAYTTCRLIYCHSNGSRTQGNYSAPNNAGQNQSSPWPNWSSSRNFTTTMSIFGYNMKTRCARCHGNTAYRGMTMAMPNYTGMAYGGPKENSHRKHVIENKFRCNVCHSSTVNSANNAIANTQNHVNRFYNISIVSAYRKDGIGRNYSSVVKTCKSITCHAGKTTPAWGSKIGCADCHLDNAVDYDKRILNNIAFQNFSETAPKIYSASWAESGHGRQGSNYYGKDSDGANNGNLAANRACANCHKASVPHNTANNPFRLYTLHQDGNPNALCEDCHGLDPGNPDAPQVGAKTRGIQTHSSSVVDSKKYNFAIKCIDCHDPHGDNNILMLHSSVARPRITSGTRRELSDSRGRLLTNITTRNIDFGDNQYTSNYARKSQAAKICQNCHTQTKDVSAPYGGRFRWYSAGDKTHGGSKCVNCHSHAKGFKGEGCNGCHGWPPTSLQNIISGAGRINPTKKRASGSVAAGAHFKHFTTFINVGSPALTRTTVCGLCHKGGMYPNGSENRNIDLGFNAFGVYTTGKYRGQSAVATGYYGYSGVAALSGTGPGNNDNAYRCQNVKCHGAGGNWLTKSFGNVTTPRWDDNTRNSVFCGSCHGAKKGSGSGTWPTSNRHQKHAGYPSGTGYDFMCRLCHADTVMGTATTLNKANHVNGEATFKFYTGTFTGERVWSQSKYTSGDTKVNSGFGWCKNLYCHSRGTKTLQPYTGIAFPNYTAKWDAANLPASATEKCSYCHGSRKSAGGYAGITSAMPNQANQAHKKHVVDNGFKCYFCHAATVDSSNAIVSTTNHVNKFKNISIVAPFRQGQTMYSSSLSSTNKTCKNVKCHAGRKTPNWTTSTGINCTDCHYQSSGAAGSEDSFAWTNFSGTAAKIYSTEWTDHGHGRARPGRYPFSNRTGAAKVCYNCHSPIIKHGDANYFRIRTTGNNVAADPDKLCLRCHGSTGQLAPSGFSRITGIKTHSWANISTAGYKTGNKDGKAGWNFGQDQRAKCVDCHDPHGDRKNNYMIHSYVNMSGSDSVGRPTYSVTGVQMIFTAVGGPQINWSSYVKSDFSGLCQRCHSPDVANFDKAQYGDPTGSHNNGQRCVMCHKHKGGFAPSGCDSCHGDSTRMMGRGNWSPPKGPNATWSDSLTNRSSLHQPHAYNPRKRAGFGNQTGFECQRCHDDSLPAGNHNSGKNGANLNNLTSQTGWQGASRLSKVNYGANNRAPADDTCWNTKCHTPRSYTRQWKRPTGCDDCHGYRNKTETTAQAFKIQTTGSHKIHVNYSTPGIAGTDFKKYGLRCSNCHYDWQGLGNYSTHYSSYVNITANGTVNTIANMKVKEGQFYTKGRLFKGFTTGNESFGTCAKAYCHGNFTNGTTGTMPNWKKGVSPVTCLSCHKGRLTFNNGSTMPERHQKHVKTNQYGFACVKCHMRTTNNITTIIFNYSSHVNGRKDVYFNNDLYNGSGTFNSSDRFCSNIYCHSKGYRSSPAGSFTTRTTIANYTADWDIQNVETKTGTGKKCSFCHGNKIYNGITAAMPNQTSLWGNSHRTHVIRNNFRCVNCHAATVNAAGQIATYGNHVNGFKNISIIAMYKSGQTMYSSQVPSVNKTCKNVKCHAGKTTPKWGTSATCKNCHFVATGGDTDDYANFRSFTGTAAKIYSTEWATKGHGSVGKNIQCTDCHKATAPHNGKDSSGNVRNPYRLLTSQPNALCGNCHGSSGERNALGGEIASIYQGYKPHTKTATGGNAAWNTHTSAQGRGVKCIDCHDPHGDKNRKMIHAYINHSGSDRFGRPKGRPWTDGADTNAVAMMTFTAWGGQLQWSSFATGNLSQSICRRCHTPFTQDTGMGDQPASPAPGNMTKGNYAADHQSHGAKCTSCHTHPNGFKGGACNGCHGFPPTGTFNLLSGLNRSNEIKRGSSGNVDRPGAHGRHTTMLLPGTTGGNDLKAVCSYCHSGGMADTSNDDDDITLRFRAFNYYTGDTQKYKGAAAVRDGFYGYSGKGAGTADGSFMCQSVKCHGAQGSWLTKSFGNVTAPRWNDTSRNSVYCGSCHGAKKEANKGTWPTTKAHAFHAGTSIRQQDLMCRTCHGITVLGSATTLSKANHVNGKVFVELTSAGGSEPRIGGDSAYTGNDTVNTGFGQCNNVYCHSTGTDRVAPYSELPNFAATWTTIRGTYKKANGQLAKCNFCHGSTMSGVTSAMPNYPNDNPKANKHSKHVLEYNFLCANCHDKVVANNTAIQGGNYGLHVNRVYNVDFGTGSANPRSIDNNQGRYTSTNSGCRATYCHSRGADLVAPYNDTASSFPNYTAHWGDNRGGYKQPKANMAKCNYCHGSRNAYSGMTSAMPNYAPGSPKINRHPMHVVKYGFSCTVCHDKVTSNSTSIDAAGGSDLHVNKIYNVDFNSNVPGRFNTNTGVSAAGSKCRNTYCHSRGTDFTKPYGTRTSLSNFTAAWGDDRGGYKQAKGVKAKCNYCHGNKLFSGMTSAMPNYSTSTAKNNTHPLHVRTYGFTCTVCHEYVTNNNSSIDAAGGTGRHVNQAYNIDFKNTVPNRSFLNNTGDYTYIQNGKSRCKNTYCHSRGTKVAGPYASRTTLSNFTGMWGDSRNGYRQAKGVKAKCNYCHGNRAYSGMTSAMPNYSGTTGSGYVVTAKANSHRVHVVGNGFVCSTCHNSIAMNNTSISDRTRHVNGFYNISITPGRRKPGGQKVYSMVYNGGGGTCMNNTCHGDSKPQWGNPNSANCKSCHFSGTKDTEGYGLVAGAKAELYSSEWRRKGHGRFDQFTSRNINRCERCHKPSVSHNYAQSPVTNPFRLMTSVPDKLCAGCHGSATERNASWGVGINATNVDYITHSKAATGGDASWNTHSSISGKGPKCIDCHDPHGDKNRKMIHSYLNHSGSDKFGRPKGRPWTEDGQIGYSTAAMMTFTTWGNAQPIWSSFANGNASNASRSICRRCHTPKANDGNMGNKPSPNFGEMTKSNYAVDHQGHGATCTAACHSHKEGFKGGGESTGGQACSGCHSVLYNAMTSKVNSNMPAYHHVLSNANPTYSNVTLFNGGALRDQNRRCLMCHVDHNRFRSDAPYLKTRSKNLRPTASTTGNYTTGINTDFWPAKRKGGRADGTANYSATRPVTGPAGMFGVCASCHKNAQSKNTTFQTNNQGQYATPVFGTTNFIATYTSSSHNFQIISGMNKFFTDGSRFRANCSKCHGSPEYAIQNPGSKGQTGAREKFGLHDTKYQSLNRPMGNITAMPNPLSKQLCFRCHGTIVRGSYDYYSSIKMNTGAKLIQTAIEAKPISNHPVGQYAGHKPDEYSRATQGWNNYIDASGNDVKHIECPDCHNTHGGNASIVRSIGSPNGNRISGAQAGVWGVTTSGLTGPGVDPTYNKRQQVTYQWQVCAKCHTKFAWGSNHPIKAPSQGYNSLNNYSVYLTDVIKEFNPQNYGYHPVMKPGRNQPGKAANPSWPTAAANVRWFDEYNNISGLANISGLDWAFNPPFNRRSTIACTDCHQADSTGKAITSANQVCTITPGGWTTPGNMIDTDGAYAQSPGNTTAVEIDVAGSTFTAADTIEIVVTAYANGKNKTLNWGVYNGGTQQSTGTMIFTTGSAQTQRATAATGCTNSTCLNGDGGCNTTGDVTIRLWSAAADVFYVDKASLEATFTMTDALRGPHGSMMQWILASANTQLKVDWNNDKDAYLDAGEVVNPAAQIDLEYEKRTFCWNCHRFRTYQVDIGPNGDYSAAEGNYSRFKHYQVEAEYGGGADSALERFAANKWGIPCMFCHGGGKTGAIHGDWQGANWGNATLTNTRPVSVRLLNGAGATYQTIAGSGSPTIEGDLTCYLGTTSGGGLGLLGGTNACTASGDGTYGAEGTVDSTIFNYSYTGY